MSKKTLIIIGVVVVLALGFFMTSQRRNSRTGTGTGTAGNCEGCVPHRHSHRYGVTERR